MQGENENSCFICCIPCRTLNFDLGLLNLSVQMLFITGNLGVTLHLSDCLLAGCMLGQQAFVTWMLTATLT